MAILGPLLSLVTTLDSLCSSRRTASEEYTCDDEIIISFLLTSEIPIYWNKCWGFNEPRTPIWFWINETPKRHAISSKHVLAITRVTFHYGC